MYIYSVRYRPGFSFQKLKFVSIVTRFVSEVIIFSGLKRSKLFTLQNCQVVHIDCCESMREVRNLWHPAVGLTVNYYSRAKSRQYFVLQTKYYNISKKF